MEGDYSARGLPLAAAAPRSVAPTRRQRSLSTPPRPPSTKPPDALLRRASAKLPTMVTPLAEEACVSDFEVVAELGRGAFGRTVAARRKQCDQEKLIAVKIVTKSLLGGIRVERHQEALLHPFVARCLWVEETDARAYSATEVYSSSLDELARAVTTRGAFDDVSALFYISELALALDYLHSKNVVHAALKPSNILVDRRGHVALSDIGLLSAHLSPSMIDFAPPERLRDEHVDGVAGDWWSLGAVAYFFLAGSPPFQGPTPRDLFINILHQPPAFDARFEAAFFESPPSFASCSLSEEDDESAAARIAHRSSLSSSSRRFAGSPTSPGRRIEAARNALRGLLSKNPAFRTASLDALKVTSWFDTVAWDDILQKLLDPPHSPQLVLYVDSDTPRNDGGGGGGNDFQQQLTRISSRGSRCSSPLPSLDSLTLEDALLEDAAHTPSVQDHSSPPLLQRASSLSSPPLMQRASSLSSPPDLQ
ncbi:hypothetical protein CTAYLR_004366 [Chrysophaeum taylorii]|uniref:non-specific serine/threonine protein kinase n=1 Tax=Chrysophaeum taylorii TaxID=2483200 RepID=A0AAD7UMI9_9STRA|nr:hypothetical protein CTAYLR_004366 [Chrysophaeum taylorii]